MEYEQDVSQTSQITQRETQPLDIPATVLMENTTTLVAGMQQLVDEILLLRQDFDAKSTYDEHYERRIESLSSELQDSRAGLHFKILRPMIFALITMHDNLSTLIESVSHEKNHISIVHVIKNLAVFQITIEEILQSNGIEHYAVDGETFIPGKQRSLQIVETSEPYLDQHIARRVRKGFAYDEKVLRPELVITYHTV